LLYFLPILFNIPVDSVVDLQDTASIKMLRNIKYLKYPLHLKGIRVFNQDSYTLVFAVMCCIYYSSGVLRSPSG
jgi:hypothetical protein